MKKDSYRRSWLWRLVFLGLPIVVFVSMYMEVSHWEKPKGGPTAIHEEELTPRYQAVTIVLAAVAAIPYLGLLLRFWERLQITDDFIRRKGLLRNKTLPWKDIIEFRDFLNYIQLVPIYEPSGLYIDYYLTFNKHKQLTRVIGRKCREVEANAMVRRRQGKLTFSDLGVPATIVLMVGSALLLYFMRQRIVFLGISSGVVLALVSAWVWVVTRCHPERWKSGGYLYAMLFVLFLILPPAYFAQAIMTRGLKVVGIFGLLYFVGLLTGSSATSALLPSRKRK